MKEGYIIEKAPVGTITIQDFLNFRFCQGFICPNKDGVSFGKFMKSIKDGDNLIIKRYKVS